MIVAGAGMGWMLGPANTDAVNRAGNLSYGEATGITQTIRNFGASLGLAALGTILLFNFRSHLTSSLQAAGDPHPASTAAAITQSQQGRGSVASIPHYVSLDFAHATEAVLFVMCGIMALAGLIALIGLERGRQETVPGVERGTETAGSGRLISATRRPTLDDGPSASGGLSVGMRYGATIRPRRGAVASLLCQGSGPRRSWFRRLGSGRRTRRLAVPVDRAQRRVRPRDGLQCRNQGERCGAQRRGQQGHRGRVRPELQP